MAEIIDNEKDNNFKISIFTPSGVFCTEFVDMAILNGIEGEFGVLKSHMNFMTILSSGLVKMYLNDKLIKLVYLADGLAEISEDQVSIISDMVIDLTKHIITANISTNISNLESIENPTIEGHLEIEALKYLQEHPIRA